MTCIRNEQLISKLSLKLKAGHILPILFSSTEPKYHWFYVTFKVLIRTTEFTGLLKC